MLKRLYLRIYLTIVLSLGIVVLVAGVLWRNTSEVTPFRQALDLASELAASAVAPPTESAAAQQESLVALSHRLGTSLSLFDQERRPIAHSGEPLPPPPPDGRGWIPPPDGPAWALNLPDGRWLVLRVSLLKRNPALGLLFALGSIALAVALAVFPVARGLTRRLERLQSGVESLGGGDLAARVQVEGRDEVARLAESFNRAAARIEELVGAHKMLLANASHELRTPLARIRLGIELSRQNLDPQRRRELERDILELDELIGEILLASRLDAAHALEEDEDVDLLALTAEECARYDDCTVDGESCMLRGDARLLRRLVRNLLENAQRHGAPPIEATVMPEDGGVRLMVHDSGPPIPEEDRARLFERFHRRSGQSSQGTGLGLSLVRQIAERHGGVARYEVDAAGARFSVWLPPAPARSLVPERGDAGWQNAGIDIRAAAKRTT